jgi:hypothetical protein
MRLAIRLAAAIAVIATTASAQDRKIEVSPFAGGYFSAGYQSFVSVSLLGGIAPIGGLDPDGTTVEFRPADEPNSGIFGARKLRPQ